MATEHPKPVLLLLVGWCAVGVCLALSVSALGLFTVPLGAILIAAMARRSTGADLLGMLVGVGGVAVAIGLIHLDYHPCPSDGALVLVPGQAEVSCGGFDGLPWLLAGGLLIVAGAVSYATVAVRSSRGRA